MKKQAKNGSGTWPGDAMSWEADWDSNSVHLAQEFLNLTINLHSSTPRYQSGNVWQDSMSLLYKLKWCQLFLKQTGNHIKEQYSWQNDLPVSFVSLSHLQLLTGVNESCYTTNSEQLT